MPATPHELLRLARRIPEAHRRWGVLGSGRRAVDKVGVLTAYPVRRRRLSGATFDLGGRPLPYFVHPYNATWRGERMVEIPVALDFLERHPGRVLEVGNVLHHYGRDVDVVVDKYEQSSAVLNVDIVDYTPDEPFDAIVAISTFEHVGWDESPREPAKLGAAVQHARSLLRDGGRLLLTCPRGYNDWLDAAIAGNDLEPDHEHFLHRDGDRWSEQTRATALGLTPRYVDAGLTRSAHDVWVGVWTASHR